ncbi:MAG: O-acetylhomoserine aminocarboxypropyltransferase/cysteine synthase, partial [Clostridia bacterium]|nr:O-acetylhomoserine aminocarboxypropyltransferase/cysteine synthase [Clostridia bacterium]
MAETSYGFETLQLHAGQAPDKQTHARAVPIYQTTSYCYPCAQEAADVFSGAAEGFTYTRIENPTVRVLEERLTALEGGKAAIAFASGMAAISAAVFGLCSTGDHIVAISTLYGGTVTKAMVDAPTDTVSVAVTKAFALNKAGAALTAAELPAAVTVRLWRELPGSGVAAAQVDTYVLTASNLWS